MKKILAVLLSVLMLSSTGVIGAIFVGAESTSGSGAITIDGKFDEPAWVADGWTHVDSSNAKLQTPLKEGEIRRENYDFQMRTDDANLYVAMKFNAPPVATNDKYGNGNGTTFRLWTFTDGMKDETGAEYITYNYILEYYYKPSGDVFVVRKNTKALGNSSIEVTNTSGATASSTKGDDYWYVEMKIPFTLLGSTVGCHFYLTVSSPKAINGSTVVENNAWAYPYYGDGMEANVNADAMYVEWNKANDLYVRFDDIRIGKLPATAQKIDNFADYVGSTTTVITRVDGKTTLGEISAITTGSTKDYNYFYLVAVDANNRVTEIDHTLGRPQGVKTDFVVPEGGFVLLCNGNKSDTHTQAVIDAFAAIQVGDLIALYNVDLKELAEGKTKTNLTNAGFTVSKKVEYAEGVTMQADASKVIVRNNKALGVLSDGKTELVDSSKEFNDEQVVLFQNLVCKEKGNYPVVDLILNLGAPIKFDTVNLSFYHQYGVMIGLPKDNKVTISYANDPANFTTLGDYTFEGAAAKGTQGVLPANIALGKTILAKYVKVSFAFGEAPWGESGQDGKVNWEFIGMTEFGVSSTVPTASYTLLSNADQVVTNKAFTSTFGDYKTALDNPNVPSGQLHNDAQVVLFQNKVCTTPNLYPKVEVVLAYANPKTIDTIILGFFHNYDVMIGLPKDNKVSLSYSNDHAAGYTSLGDITIEGTAEKGKNGVISIEHKLDTAIKARFIKLSFEFGPAPWGESGQDGKVNWEFIGMTEFNTRGYAEGVTATYTNVSLEPNTRSLRSLIDGKTAKSVQTFKDGSVLLFKNTAATDASKQAKVELLFSLSKNMLINKVTLNFYHEYISMIGLPKDNKVTISYANNYNDFTTLGDFTFEGKAESGNKGVISAVIPFGKAVTAKYVKVAFEFGPSPFTDKPVWEFIALTEVSFTYLPENSLLIDNFGDYVGKTTTILTRVNGKTTIGEVSEITYNEAKDYNMFYLVAVGADNKVTAINHVIDRNKNGDEAKKDNFVIPEGGYVLLCHSEKSDTHTEEMIDAFLAIEVGDIITLYNVDLEALAAGATKQNLENAGFTVTKSDPGPGPEPGNPFELKDPDHPTIRIVDGMLLGITDTMTVDDIKALFVGEVTVEKVGTGATITAGGQSIVMVIAGDIDGDGVIDSVDYLLVKRAILGNTTLNEVQMKAACVSDDDELDPVDYLMIKRHIVGTDSLFD